MNGYHEISNVTCASSYLMRKTATVAQYTYVYTKPTYDEQGIDINQWWHDGIIELGIY